MGNKIEPYPKREAIQPAPGQVIAYAHPADVYNLQVQGSGRLRFSDGTQRRGYARADFTDAWNRDLTIDNKTTAAAQGGTETYGTIDFSAVTRDLTFTIEQNNKVTVTDGTGTEQRWIGPGLRFGHRVAGGDLACQ